MRKLRRAVVHNKMYNRGMRRVNRNSMTVVNGRPKVIDSYFSRVWRDYK